jgi:hypothetical protein
MVSLPSCSQFVSHFPKLVAPALRLLQQSTGSVENTIDLISELHSRAQGGGKENGHRPEEQVSLSRSLIRAWLFEVRFWVRCHFAFKDHMFCYRNASALFGTAWCRK